MKTVLVSLLLALPLTSAIAEAAPPAKTAPHEVRFVPTVRDGKPYGVKVYAIKAGSRYDKLGFKNGDTLLAVDGQSVNDTATEAAFRAVIIEGSRDGAVELERAGTKLTLALTATRKP